MKKRTRSLPLFVWVPWGFPTGTHLDDLTAIYHFLVLLVGGLILGKLLTLRSKK